MIKNIEKQFKKCSCCGQLTAHYRRNVKPSKMMIAMHGIITLITAGIWLIIYMLAWLYFDKKINKWECYECQRVKDNENEK
ncbi:MAG: hypothetical protein ACK5MF_05015 [Vibrio sp.]|uniref:hypothetical protein n=1 Tax=Vibrio sp. TaxID=678 RepID=UPI003A8ADBC3